MKLHYPHRPDPEYPPPNVAGKSPAPPISSSAGSSADRVDRRHFDECTRDIFRRFDARDLEPLK